MNSKRLYSDSAEACENREKQGLQSFTKAAIFANLSVVNRCFSLYPKVQKGANLRFVNRKVTVHPTWPSQNQKDLPQRSQRTQRFQKNKSLFVFFVSFVVKILAQK
ncbi:MAG: hypothetical protein KBG20_21615, partial [Caldilineaceae bacterium]|nr:hypothetical protein [Caldilineaceae bacterium]MBP9074920.1 hypothetical protein [Caldilineaceae bacterium]